MRHADHSLWFAALPTNRLTNNCWVWRARWFRLLKSKKTWAPVPEPNEKVGHSGMELYLSKGRARSQQAHILVADGAQWLTLEFGLCPPYAHTNTDVCAHTCTSTHKKKEKRHCQKAGMVTWRYNTEVMEAGGPEVHGHCQSHRSWRSSLSYRRRCLNFHTREPLVLENEAISLN